MAPTPLQTAVESASSMPPCRSVIAVEWAHGWPVPASDGIKRFKIFYYPLTGTPTTGPQVYTPTGEAVLDAAAGKPISCMELSETPRKLSGPRWPAAVEAADMRKFDQMSASLYARTESIAAAFQAKLADKKLAKEYLSVFQSMAEPSLLPYYYRLNPDFWEWLRKTANASIPKST